MASRTPSSYDIKEQNPPSTPNHGAQGSGADEMPDHWKFTRGGSDLPHQHFCWWPPLHFIYHLMCIIGLGHASLVQVWEACRENADPEAWKALREIVGGELEHINLVAGLLVSATVGFCTSDPPGRIPYSRTLPYCVLLTSVIFSIAGLVVGVSCAFIINRSSPKWVREYLAGSRPRIWATMFMLSFPFIAVAVAATSAAAALLIATSYSDDKAIRIVFYFFIAPPPLCFIAFIWMSSNKGRDAQDASRGHSSTA